MEVYTIEKGTNRRLSIIENFESFIWTERYNAYGDFELVCEYNENNASKLTTNAYVGCDMSDRIMIVKKVTKEQDDEGAITLKVEGKSFESIFQDRVAGISISASSWTLNGDAAKVIRNMVKLTCVDGKPTSNDWIFGLEAPDIWPPGNTINMQIKRGSNLYDKIREVALAYDLGFKVTYELQYQPPPVIGGSVIYNAPLIFSAYKGVDLTTGYNAVSFSDDNDTLFNSTSIASEENYKNVAYVYSNTHTYVVDENPPELYPGFTRKPIYVDATDITTTAQDYVALLSSRGKEALSDHNKQVLVDGQINPDGVFKYKEDYNLGDIVLIKSITGEQQSSRVSEYIWTYDAEGLNGYPTLTAIV